MRKGKQLIFPAKFFSVKRSKSLPQEISPIYKYNSSNLNRKKSEIQLIAAQEFNYEHNKKLALARLDRGYSLGGGKMPKREELYNR